MKKHLNKLLFLLTYFVGFHLSAQTINRDVRQKNKPLKILLITGGCCHNYNFQSQAIKDAVDTYKKADWTVVNEGGNGTNAIIPLYDKKDWAKSYDVVIHNECFADTKDSIYISKIVDQHYKGIPAVVIHCAMHSYRALSSDIWRQFLGVTTRRHDHQSNYPVTASINHPILKGFPAKWTTPMDELYVIEKLWPSATALATSVSEKDGKTYPVIWTNKFGKARIMGTTFGHGEATFKDPVYLQIIARGVLWAAGRLRK